MKVKALKKFKWSINYKAVEFEEGKEYAVEDSLANKMIDNNYCLEEEAAPEEEIHKPKKKKDIIEENKAMESTDENKSMSSEKEDEESGSVNRKSGRPRKKR